MKEALWHFPMAEKLVGFKTLKMYYFKDAVCKIYIGALAQKNIAIHIRSFFRVHSKN